jgi:hypothetical protein
MDLCGIVAGDIRAAIRSRAVGVSNAGMVGELLRAAR